MKFKAVRGFKDWLPEGFIKYDFLINIAKDILKKYNYREIKIPILEKTELFVRSIGEVTDIVQKETYTFQDRNKEFLTLRPEATAGICRMVIEHGVYAQAKPLKFFTVGPMFRHERPQKGRLREFYQVDVEFFGSVNPFYEVELIQLALNILKAPFKELGLKEERFTLEINSLGCEKCRPEFRNYLVSELGKKEERLCETCMDRLRRNPLRILDCKNEKCKEVLKEIKGISEFWCDECRAHFQEIKELLKTVGIDFVHNSYLVRGLDYYVRTIFEIKAEGLGAQDTVCAGGRYDKLLSELGGPELPAIGFAIGVERWALTIFSKENQEEKTLPEKLSQSLKPEVFLVLLGKKQFKIGLQIAKELRESKIKTEVLYEEKSLKALLRDANRAGVKFALILGEEELKKGKIIVKDMEAGSQKEVEIKNCVNEVKNLLEKEK
jgi:histidyl-tRNA synthetase